MKIDLSKEALSFDLKDAVKVGVLFIGGIAAAYTGHGDKAPERLAIVETKVEQVRADVAEIKALLLRGRWR